MKRKVDGEAWRMSMEHEAENLSVMMETEENLHFRWSRGRLPLELWTSILPLVAAGVGGEPLQPLGNRERIFGDMTVYKPVDLLKRRLFRDGFEYRAKSITQPSAGESEAQLEGYLVDCQHFLALITRALERLPSWPEQQKTAFIANLWQQVTVHLQMWGPSAIGGLGPKEQDQGITEKNSSRALILQLSIRAHILYWWSRIQELEATRPGEEGVMAAGNTYLRDGFQAVVRLFKHSPWVCSLSQATAASGVVGMVVQPVLALVQHLLKLKQILKPGARVWVGLEHALVLGEGIVADVATLGFLGSVLAPLVSKFQIDQGPNCNFCRSRRGGLQCGAWGLAREILEEAVSGGLPNDGVQQALLHMASLCLAWCPDRTKNTLLVDVVRLGTKVSLGLHTVGPLSAEDPIQGLSLPRCFDILPGPTDVPTLRLPSLQVASCEGSLEVCISIFHHHFLLLRRECPDMDRGLAKKLYTRLEGTACNPSQQITEQTGGESSLQRLIVCLSLLLVVALGYRAEASSVVALMRDKLDFEKSCFRAQFVALWALLALGRILQDHGLPLSALGLISTVDHWLHLLCATFVSLEAGSRSTLSSALVLVLGWRASLVERCLNLADRDAFAQDLVGATVGGMLEPSKYPRDVRIRALLTIQAGLRLSSSPGAIASGLRCNIMPALARRNRDADDTEQGVLLQTLARVTLCVVRGSPTGKPWQACTLWGRHSEFELAVLPLLKTSDLQLFLIALDESVKKKQGHPVSCPSLFAYLLRARRTNGGSNWTKGVGRALAVCPQLRDFFIQSVATYYLDQATMEKSPYSTHAIHVLEIATQALVQIDMPTALPLTRRCVELLSGSSIGRQLRAAIYALWTSTDIKRLSPFPGSAGDKFFGYVALQALSDVVSTLPSVAQSMAVHFLKEATCAAAEQVAMQQVSGDMLSTQMVLMRVKLEPPGVEVATAVVMTSALDFLDSLHRALGNEACEAKLRIRSDLKQLLVALHPGLCGALQSGLCSALQSVDPNNVKWRASSEWLRGWVARNSSAVKKEVKFER